MRLRHRPPSAADFKAWLQASSVKNRYGELYSEIPGVWAALHSNGSALSVVVEDLDAPSSHSLVGLGLSLFVTDEFVRHVKSSSPFWIGPELIGRIKRNESPILDLAEIRRGNSRVGLNLVVWEVFVRPVSQAEFLTIITELSTAFFNIHAGFKIKEVMGQQPFGPVLRGAIQVGGWLMQNGRGEYVSAPDPDVIEKAGEPFVLGLTRKLAEKVPGFWLSTLFDYRTPNIFFTASEQRLLCSALEDRTDDEIANQLGISCSAVKKCWQSIYNRTGVRLPHLLPDDCANANGRGTEKKRRLLAYVRSHPEELRPLLPSSRTRAVPRTTASS
jgi:hypothetical protein